jgi:hypothetical protein
MNDLVARDPAHGALVAQETRELVAQVAIAMGRQIAAAMAEVKLELKAIVNDNSVLRENMSLLNRAVGRFEENTAIPLREELKELVHDQGARVKENQTKLEVVIQALVQALDKRGIAIPQDLKESIEDGHFEDLEHRKANEIAGSEIRGYVPQHVVQTMIDAAVTQALAAERARHPVENIDET